MARTSASGGGGAGGAPAAGSVYRYNEVTNVLPGLETLITSYTAVSTADCYLQQVASSGTNMAEFRVYINGVVSDKQYSSLTQFGVQFDYFTGNTSVPGVKLSTGDIVTVKALQNRPYSCNFNATIQILEVTT